MSRKSSRAGITLMELLVVMTLLGLMVGVSYPSISAGLESLRLSSATDSIVSFLNSGLNRAERRQQVVEITISKRENALWLRSAGPGFVRKLELPEGVTIARVLPEFPGAPAAADRSVLLYPGSAPPRIGVEVSNRRGARRIVSVDPISGIPVVEQLEQGQ